MIFIHFSKCVMYSIIKTYYVELFKKRDWFDKAQKNQDLGKMNQ